MTSRCTIPARWAACSACAACATTDMVDAGSSRPARRIQAHQRLAVDVLHHQVTDLAVVGERGGAEVVHLHDARVPQRGHHPGLGVEPGGELGVGDQRRQQHLHRDLAVQQGVGALPDGAHAAGRDAFAQPVTVAEDHSSSQHRATVPAAGQPD